MDRWKAFFDKAGGDIWTVIEKAIILAATDYPKEFKDKRSVIAETLFARSLLQSHSGDTDATRLSGSVVTNATNQIEENELRNDEEEAERPREVFGVEQERHHCSYNDAEALTDQMEEETLLLREIYRIKETLVEPDQSETILVDSLQRLEYLQVTVEALKATELGKHVNAFRKHPSKRVRFLVKRLVRGWKDLVDEWVKTAGDIAAAAIAGSEEGGPVEALAKDHGLPSPPLDEGALLAARTTSLELSQIFNFIDDIPGCGDANGQGDDSFQAVDLSTGDNLYPSKFQLRIMQTDYRKCDTETSMSNDEGEIRVPEERGSTNRVEYGGFNRLDWKPEPDSRNSASQKSGDQKELNPNLRILTGKNNSGSSGPGRPAKNMSKVKISDPVGSLGSGRQVRSHDCQRTSGVGMDISQPDRNWKPSNQKAGSGDDLQEARKLELAKRNLHERYQQAENAKKQRTVQLVDLPDLPKGGPNRGKPNMSSQSRPGSQNWQWHQNRK